jgi:hypothetical protein
MLHTVVHVFQGIINLVEQKKGDYKAGFFQEVAFGALVGEEKEK